MNIIEEKKPIPLFKKKKVPEEWYYYRPKYGSVNNICFHSDSDMYEVMRIGEEKLRQSNREKSLRICCLVDLIWANCGIYYEEGEGHNGQ